MRSPALSRVVRGLSSRTSTAALIAGLVLVAPITNAISAGFSGTVASTTPGISASSQSVTFNSSIAGSDHGVITWTPTDDAVNAGAPIDFLPSGQTVTFSGSGSAYTILNKIVPTDISRPLGLNGTITAFLGSSGANGGNIWFYSPGGILVGGGAVFNVGSLLLTSLNPAGSDNGNNSFINNGTFSLGQSATNSKVTISAGAQINASTQSGSYVALIAPTVTQSGTVTVNGSAAYVAAEQADMTINQGLFDINVTIGSSATSVPLVHDGTTTGPAAGQDEFHRVYLVAVPKNSAITMLITGNGTLGFDVAGAADVSGNAIILSAGRNIVNGVVDPNSSPSTASADININNGAFTSAVTGYATRNASVFGTAPTHFYSDLALTAPVSAAIYASSSNTPVTIDRNLTLDAGVGIGPGSSVTGGVAQVNVSNGGMLTVGGDLNIFANADSSRNSTSGFAVNATGGAAQIFVSAGTLDVAGQTLLTANAFSGPSVWPSLPSGSPLMLTGGQAAVQVAGSSTVNLRGTLSASALASVSNDLQGNVNPGPNAQGGTVTLTNNSNGSLTVGGSTALNASASAGDVSFGPAGGTATGGTINVSALAGTTTLTSGLSAEADAQGGSASSIINTGGAGTGGVISVGAITASATLNIGDGVDLSAIGEGGASGSGTAGLGHGGSASLNATAGTTHVAGDISIDASAFGGAGQTSGGATGGAARLDASTGTLTIDGGATLRASAYAGAAFGDDNNVPHAGNAIGGTITLSTEDAGQMTVSGNVSGEAQAYIGNDSSSDNGGNATGGTFGVSANGTGTLHLAGNIDGDVSAGGGSTNITTGAPGSGSGGTFFVDARNTTTVTIDGLLSGTASGSGGRTTVRGTGGSGMGGTITAGGGSGHLMLNSVDFDVSGYGGDGIIAGGTGNGGSIFVQTFTQGGVVQISNGVTLAADARGGDGALDSRVPNGMVSTGGIGSGGDALVQAINGTITIGDHISLSAAGTGGDGYNGGDGIGGGINGTNQIGAELYAKSGSLTFTTSPNSPNMVVSADGHGGLGGTGSDGTAGHGGAGIGGFARIFALNSGTTGLASTIFLPTNVIVTGTGVGGAGGDNTISGVGGAGGTGTGAGGGPAGTSGQILVNAQVGDGHVSITSLTVDSTGTGGNGGAGQTGGVGGVGTGGFNQVGVYSGTLTATNNGTGDFGTYTSKALGVGGTGGMGSGGAGGAGGSGRGGAGSIVSRGGSVTASSVDFRSYGQGGDGGDGDSQGVGGDGRGGNFAVLSTPRFQTTTTGSLTVNGSITGSAQGKGGVGSQTGATSVGDFEIHAIGGTITAQNITANASGTLVPSDAVASEIASTGTGLITVTNLLSATSGGDIGLYFDQGGRLNAATSQISARSITPFGELDTTAPTGTGIFHANSMTFNVLHDFRTTTSFDTPGNFSLTAPGAIQMGTINAGNIYLNFDPSLMTSPHGASVLTGDLTATGSVIIDADGATSVGSVNAGNLISLNFNSTTGATHGTSLTTGNLTSGRTVMLQTDGNASIGSVTARDSLISIAQGTTLIGNISAGRGAALAATQQGYVINVSSNAGATIGSSTAKGEIRFTSLNGSISAGDIVTDRDLIVQAGQDVSLNAITTALVPTLGGPTSNQTTNPGGVYIGLADGTVTPAAQLFSIDAAPIGGSITITGPVTTGLFNVAAQGNMTTGTIMSQGDIQADIGGTIKTGAITSGESIIGSSGSSSTYGALVAGDGIQVQAGGDMTVASASAGRVNPSANSQATYQIGIQSATNTMVGDLTAKGNIGLLAQSGNIKTDNVMTDQSLVALSGNNISLGTVSTATTGSSTGVYLANASMYPLVANNPDPATLFATAPVAVGGSIQIDGPVSTSAFVASAHGAFTASAITAADRIKINFDSTSGATHGTALTTGNLTSGQTILLQTDGNAAIGSATASDSIITVSAGTTNIGNLSAGRVNPVPFTGVGYIVNVFANGGSTIGSTTAKGEVRFGSLNGSISAGDIVTDRDLIVLAKQNVSLGAITTALAPTLGGPTNNQTTNPGGVYIGHATGTIVPADQTFAMDPTPIEGVLTITGPVTTGIFNVAAMGNLTIGALTSQGDLDANSAGTIMTGAITSGQSIHIASTGNGTYGALVAGDGIQVQAGGTANVASASAGRVNPSSNSDADYQIGIRSSAGTNVGDVTAKGSIGLLATSGNVSVGNVATDQSFVALSANDIATGGITTAALGSSAGVYLANASMYSLVANNLVPATLFATAPVAAGGSIQIGGPVATSRFAAAANGTFMSSSINASDLLNINFNSAAGATHGTGLTTGNLTSGKLVLVQSDGNISTGSVTASDSMIIASTGGTATLGNLSAGLVNAPANSGQGYSAQVFATNGATIGSITAKGEVRLQTLSGSITAADITTGRDLVVLAKQNVTLGAVTTSPVPTSSGSPTNPVTVPGGIYIGHSNGTAPASSAVFATIPTRVEGSISFGGAVNTGTFVVASAGAFTAPSINSNDFLSIDAGGTTTIGSLVSRYDTQISGDGAATIGSMDTGGEGHINVAGQISVGSATAGRMAFAGSGASGAGSPFGTTNPSDNGPSVVLIGGAGVTLDKASASGDIGLVSNNNVVVTGALVSDASVGALVGGNLTLGPVTTGGGANGVYIGSNSLYPSVQNADGNAAEILFAKMPPAPIGGYILLNGAVSTGRFAAASTGAFTASGALAAATDVSITSGDLATFNGALTAPTIAITSGDIAIGSSGSLGNASTTGLQLTSTTAQTNIGSTVTGASTGQTGLATSYALDDAEFGRLRAQQINLTAAGNVVLGTLNITGSASSSGNLVGSNARFQVQTPGSIRVVGSVNLANAAATDTLNFIAGSRFEIVTDTGRLQLLGADGKVGGIAAITAANIAVGTNSLLSQLAVDPKFAGRNALLSAAPATSNFDGYLRAGKMVFTVGNTLLIQNSGSADAPAGFTVGSGGIKIAGASTDNTNPIDVVIYGRAFDSSGTEVPTAMIGNAVKASQTNDTSNVDGCNFTTGTCSPINGEASVQMVAQTQTVSIASSIQSAIAGDVGAPAGSPINNGPGGSGLSDSSPAGGDSKSGNSDDGGDEPAAKGDPAAVKPNVLIDTSSISATSNTQIDTPVTSSGNTSLWIGEDGLNGVDSSGTGTNP